MVAFQSCLLPTDALVFTADNAAAYALSRFNFKAKQHVVFFVLAQRMMPPIAVAIPIFLMYRTLGLSDTHLGMILLYTAVNISLAVWLLKGFIDEIPREYEEAAMIDGAFVQSELLREDVRDRTNWETMADSFLDLLEH